MANSTTNIDGIVASQSAKEVTANAFFDAASQAATYGRRASTSSGLTWGYYGGNVVKADGTLAQIANGTLTLTASATNYIVAAKATGAVSVSTASTNWDNTTDYWRLYSVVAGAASVTSYTDSRRLAEFQGLAAVLINPMTTAGDLIIGGASGAPARLGIGDDGEVLKLVAGVPAWAAESGGGATYAPVTANAGTAITLALADAGAYLRTTAATAVTITVPPQSSVAWVADTEIHIEQAGDGAVTIQGDTGVTLNKLATVTGVIAGKHGVVTLKRTSENVWTLFGALTEAV